MMNCDQAFETMTSRETSRHPDLDSHLAGCRRCREMAEVLSPVLGELQSVRQVLESDVHFPTSGESLGVKLARRTAQDLSQQATRPAHRATASHPVSSRFLLAGVMLLLGVIGGWQWTVLQQDDQVTAAPGGILNSENCTWQHPGQTDSHSPQTVTLTCIACHLPNQSPH